MVEVLFTKVRDEIHTKALITMNASANFSIDLPEYLKNSNNYSVIVTDLNGNYIFVNELFKKCFEFLDPHLLGRPFHETIHEDDVELTNKAAYTCIKEPDKKVTVQLRKPDKKSNVYYWTEWEFSLLHDENKNPIGILCIGHDLNELNSEINLKRLLSLMEDNEEANCKLQRNLKLQKIIAEVSSSLVRTTSNSFDEDIDNMLRKTGHFFDADRSYLFLSQDNVETISNTHEWCTDGVNPKKDNLQNIPMNVLPWFKEQIQHSPFIHIPDIDELPVEAGAEKQLLNSKGIKSLLFIPIKKPGLIWGILGFDAVNSTYTWTPEHIQGLQIIANIIGDLLQKMRNEKELQDAKEDIYKKIQEIFNNVDIAMWSRNLDLEYLFMNDATVSLTGYSLRDWQTNPELWKKLYPEQDWPIVEKASEEIFEKGQHERQQVIITKSGKKKVVKITHKLVYSAEGKPTRIDSTSADITEIIDYQRKLEQLNEELKAFTYSISHDLRAPLRSIEGFTEIIREDYSSLFDEEGHKYLQRIQAASKKMSKLINDLLDLSRLSTVSINRKDINLTQMAHSVVSMLLESTPITGKKVEFKIDSNLTVTADPVMTELLLQNLLGNAIKYSTKKNNILIEFSSLIINGEKTFYIRDNGVGFNMEYAERLFMPFQRLHSENEFSGSGIGLSIAKRIVNRHGGSIWAESILNSGSTFYFKLDS